MINIRFYRESKALTQACLADLLGVKRTTVTMWETGSSKPPVDKLLQMAKIFGCTIDELLKQE